MSRIACASTPSSGCAADQLASAIVAPVSAWAKGSLSRAPLSEMPSSAAAAAKSSVSNSLIASRARAAASANGPLVVGP
jgi:hypothetical protein